MTSHRHHLLPGAQAQAPPAQGFGVIPRQTWLVPVQFQQKLTQPTPQRRAFNRKCSLPGKLAGLVKSQKKNEEPHLSEL